MITGEDFHLPYFHNKSVYFQKLCGRVKKDYTEWTRFHPNTINLHICCENSQIIPLPEVGLMVVFFSDVLSLCFLLIWRGAEHLISVYFWLDNRFLCSETILHPTGDKNCSHWLEIYHLETSGYGMHFPSFSDWFQPKSLQNSVGFTEPGHPSLQLCNGLLLQKGVDNNDLGSYIQQSPAP